MQFQLDKEEESMYDKLKSIGIIVLAVATIVGSAGGGHLSWADTAEKSQSGSSQAAVSSPEASQENKGQEAIQKEREKLVKEAVTALEETEHALKALQDNKPNEALNALSTVIGKLEIIVARDPELKFVPVDVEVTSIDILADLEKIKEALEDVREFLDEGEIQKARRLLSTLGSELVISTLSLPLATYPDAIKAIVPLIDQGKIDEAKKALEAVLDTLVVTNRIVIPLPVLRAEFFVKEAQKLAQQLETPAIASAESAEKKTQQTETPPTKQQVLDLLKAAHQQLRLAETLGYGLEEKQYTKLHEQIAAIEQKIGAEEATEGLFAKLRKTLSNFVSTFTGGEE
ncbi:MAG: hypothetical protein D6690_05405 [Nitrospirae bacterium]|nr:MAG: hypothetical protein D6690_05405 [Nitrospirota bacterium]